MGDIKTRFKLEGEQTYRKAMTDAAAVVKALNAEQKLAEAQYKATGDAQQYAEEQTRILNEQIVQQQQAVKAAEEAVAALTRNGVEPNSRQMLTWRTRLNNARTTLQNMENRLSSVGSELEDQTAALDDASDAGANYQATMERVARGIDLQNTLTAIDGVKSRLEGVVRAAASAGKGLWNMAGDAGDWADGIITASSKMGVDPETYQSWLYASRFIDTSVTDIQKSWQDIQKNMDSTSAGYTDYLAMMAKMGINSMATATQVRSTQDIFWDMIDYLHGIGNEAKRAEEATKLFGNDWRNLNPLIEAGSKAYKDYAEQGREVAVVSNEQVAALGEQDDAMEDLDARLQKLKMDLLSNLAPAFKDAANAISAAVTALDDFVQSEEGQAALAAINAAIQGIIDSFLGDDNGKESFENLVNKAQGAIAAFTSALEWISNNSGTVAGAITTIGGALVLLEVSKDVLEFFMLLKAIPLDKIKALFGGDAKDIAKGAGEVLTEGAGKTVAKKVGETATGTGVLTKVWSGIVSAAEAAAPYAVTLGPLALAVGTVYADIKATDEKWKAMLEEAAGLIDAADAKAASKGVEDAQNTELVRAATEGLVSDQWGSILDMAQTYNALEKIYAMNDGTALSPRTQLRLRKNHNEALMPEDREALLYEVVDDAMDSMGRAWGQFSAEERAEDITSSMEAISAVLTAINEADTPESIGAMRELINDLVYHEGVFDALSDETKDMWGNLLDPSKLLDLNDEPGTAYVQKLLESIYADLEADQERPVEDGRNIARGLAEGISDKADAATEATANMADDTAAAVEDTPREFYDDGKNSALGFADGIYDYGDQAIKAAQWMAASVDNIVRKELEIHSPSAKLGRDGVFTGKGFAGGIIKAKDEVDRAVDVMMSATKRKPMMTFGGVEFEGETELQGQRSSRVGQSVTPGFVHVTLMVDKQELGEVTAPIVNEVIGAKIQATRR